MQGTGPGALDSCPPAAEASHATGLQKETATAGATLVEARLAAGAHPSDSGAMVTETSALSDGVLSRVPAVTHEAREAGDSRQTSAVPAHMDDSSTGIGPSAQRQQQSKGDAQRKASAHTGAPLAQMHGEPASMTYTAPGQQQSEDGGQQEAGANTGAPSEGSSPQPPGGSSADVWRPIAEGPLHSITEVACMHLIPDFLEDIGQVAVAMLLSAPACCMEHYVLGVALKAAFV